MKKNPVFRNALILFLILANIGCDQISKSIVRENVRYQEYIEILSDNFILTKVENTGAFFGWGSEWEPGIKNIVLSLIPAAAIFAILFFLLTRLNLPRWKMIGLCFVIGGGIGNIFDRIAYGSVTDFLHMDFGWFRTGIFNMADVSIVVGMLLVLMNLNLKDEAMDLSGKMDS